MKVKDRVEVFKLSIPVYDLLLGIQELDGEIILLRKDGTKDRLHLQPMKDKPMTTQVEDKHG